MRTLFPPSLKSEIAQPLTAVAERICQAAPWKYMSDLELIGMRDDASGNLFVASILGTLGTMFAVVVYRNGPGLRSIHELATTRRALDNDLALETMDCLKVEWCLKKDLHKGDLETLEAAGFKPKGRGSVWPRFESCRPGWYPWGLSDEEGRLMIELLQRVARFVSLREISGILHTEPAVVPVIPAGDKATFRREEIEWLPFAPPPASAPEPIILSADEQDRLARLPMRKGFIMELTAPITPELSFVDETAGRPCMGRVVMMVDRASHYILHTNVAHGAAPLKEVIGPAFKDVVQTAESRPERVCVENERMAAVLRPACEAIGVSLFEGPLNVAREALRHLLAHLST